MKKLKGVSPTPTENKDDKIYPHKCPICGVDGNYVYSMNDIVNNETAIYYRCTCGIIFQDEYPGNDIYNKKYTEGYEGNENTDARTLKKFIAQCEHAPKVYAQVVEDLIYGRQMLDVGYCTKYVMNYFEKRGWITCGIDVNEDTKPGGNLYKGDFIGYDFSANISSEKLKEVVGREIDTTRKFDLIWMSHVLEHFNEPLRALKKAWDILSEGGVLYISTPDIDFINKTGVSDFPHWKKHEHYVLWSKRALCRELERLGFNIILARRNYYSRFISWYDVHIIAQKNYF